MKENTDIKRIVFLDRVSLPERFEIRRPKLAHQWVNYPSTQPSELIERCSGADVLVSNKVIISEETLLACPSVKHIAVAATGVNIIDVGACNRLGVSVSNIRNYAATSVAEHVITSALSLRRELISYRQNVINEHWQASPTFCLFGKPINDLSSSTFGVIGFGELGRATAKKASALGMRVIAASRSQIECSDLEQASVGEVSVEQVNFDELISSADIISLHCPLTPQTKNLITKKALAKMQPHTILINTARGGIANERDVVEAINNKVIGGISFDVLSEEPPKNDSPLLSIANRSNVIITPHSAWASEQAMETLVDNLADNIDAFLLGSPQNIVS